MAIHGYAASEVAAAYSRAEMLSRRLDDQPRLLEVLIGLRYFNQISGATIKAREVATRAIDVATRTGDAVQLAQAHTALSHTLNTMGDFEASTQHVEAALSAYDPSQHKEHVRIGGLDAGVFALSIGGWNLLYLGHLDEALAHAERAISLATELGDPQNLEQAVLSCVRTYIFRREPEQALRHCEWAMAISDKHGFQYRAAMARIYRAWSATMLEGPETTAEAEIRRGIEIARATGARAHATMHLCLLSDVAMRHGDRDTALAAVAEGLEIAEEQHEECWLAELYRLRGELLLSGPAADQAEAESYFEKALSLSGRQKARLWELRSAVSLACLWRDQGRSVEAIDLLAPVHGWFTEGFETLDLRDAKALLDALA